MKKPNRAFTLFSGIPGNASQWKTFLLMLTILCFLAVILIGGFGCFHPAPMLNIGNNFSQTVNVYFNGSKVGTIPPGGTKILWPAENIQNDHVLIELQSTSGEILYSKSYTWDDLFKISGTIHANPYWIGPETQ